MITPEAGPRRIEHSEVLSTFSADQVLLPDSGYGFALLHNGNSALADTAGSRPAWRHSSPAQRRRAAPAAPAW